MTYDWNKSGSETTYDWTGASARDPQKHEFKGDRRPSLAGATKIPSADERERLAELYLRDQRAGIVKRELGAYQKMRDAGQVKMTDREITDAANRAADSAMAGAGQPTGKELQEYEDLRSSAKSMSKRERMGTRAVQTWGEMMGSYADFAIKHAPASSRVPTPGKEDVRIGAGARDRAETLASLAAEESTHWTEGIAPFAAYAADPVALKAYKAMKAGLAARGGAAPAGRIGARALEEGVITTAAETAAAYARGDEDPGVAGLTAGVGAGVLTAAGKGIGAAWKKAFPGKDIPKSKTEAIAALDEAVPNWRQEEAEAVANIQKSARQASEEIQEAAKYEPGQRIEVPERGARKGIERFEARQAARDVKLQEGLDAPYVEKGKELRSPIARLEAEHAGGRVLTEADIQAAAREEVRVDALKDPDVIDEIAELETAGFTREQAEAMAVHGETPDAPKGGPAPDPLPKNATGEQLAMFQLNSGIPLDQMIGDAIKLGKWAKPHAIAGARWVMDSAGEAIGSMRDFARVAMEKFGRGVRKYVPEMWQRFKAMQARQVASRKRTARLREKGGIDLRRRPVSPEGRGFQRDPVAPKIKRAGREIRDAFNYVTQPVIDRVHKISPRLYNRLYSYATEANITKHEYRGVLDPLMGSKSIRKLPTAKRNEIKSALLNADPEGFDAAIASLPDDVRADLSEMRSSARSIMDNFFDESHAVGMTPGYLPEFWPRSIKSSRKGELRELLSGKQKSQFDDALQELATQKYGGNVELIPGEEIAATLDRVLAGRGPRAMDSSRPAPLKKRQVSQIPDKLLHLYEDFDVSMDGYIERMSNEIAKRRMLGGDKTLSLDNAENLAASIGKIISEEGITGKDADDMVSIIQSLFRGGESPLGRGTRAARSATYVLTMGQITSTLRQLEDFSTIKAQYGMANALKGTYRSALGRQQVSLLDLGLDRIAEEYAGAGSQKVVDEVFKWTGLRALDRRIKNAAIETSLLSAQKKAKQSPLKLQSELAKEFGDEEAAKLVGDLAGGEKTDRLLVYLTSKLGDMQPVTRLEVPQGYLDAREALGSSGMFRGAPVLAYQLRTFTLRRFGLLRKEAIDRMANGVTRMTSGDVKGGSKEFLAGSRRLMSMMTTFLIAGVAVDQVIDMINGKDTSISESAMDILLQTIGSSRYATEQVKRSGQSGYSAILGPPAAPTLMQLVTDAWRLTEGDTPKTLSRLPHYKTFKIFFGEDKGRPDRPTRPDRPERPTRPSR